MSERETSTRESQNREEFVPHNTTISLYINEVHVGNIDIERSSVKKDTDFISELVILSKYRRKGYGTKLLAHVLTKSRARYQETEVASKNAAAKKLFKRQGFKDTGTRRRDPETGETLMLFRRGGR